MKIPSLVIALALLWACQNTNPNTEVQTADSLAAPVDTLTQLVRLSPDQIAMAQLSIGKAQLEEVSKPIEVSGQVVVQPSGTAAVSAATDALIDQIDVAEGQRVRRGQACVRLYHPQLIDLQSAYLETKAELGYVEQEFARQQQLYQEKVATEKTFQRVQADLAKLRAQKLGAELKLELLGVDVAALDQGRLVRHVWLRAPIDGQIEHLQVHLGMGVSVGQELFRVIDNRSFRLHLRLFPQQLMGLEEGNRIEFRLPDSPQQHPGRIVSIGSAVDADTKTVGVVATADNMLLRPSHNSYVSATVWPRTRQALTVPSSAVVRAERSSVFEALGNGSYQRHWVDVVELGNEQVELLSAQPLAGKDLVLQGGHYLLSAMP